MPPTTRKTAAKKTTTPRKTAAKKVAEPVEEITVSENVENTEAVETTGARKGPKPNPFVRLAKARARAEKAREAYAKVERLAQAKDAAEAEEKAALEALQAELESVGVNSTDV